MLLGVRRAIRRGFLWAWDHSMAIAVVLVGIAQVVAVVEADRSVRNDLQLAVLDAANRVGPTLGKLNDTGPLIAINRESAEGRSRWGFPDE